ncbi:unnamed protein product [Mytilus edulis]|uniref:DUF6589 domain-containing protein n=1 Tax=Mytilus edulis TaxID=6550 RepID=A0A8S3Q9K1_MYTED|nr:unnamed protein product [Mytilus edulis]
MVLFQKCEKSNKEAEDHKLNYNRGLLWRGLNDRIRRTAVRNGDGPAMIRFWKLDLVQFHITHHPKYFILAHRLIAGVNGFLPTKLREDIIWNRTVNYTGGRGSNLEMDLVNEFLNKDFINSLHMTGKMTDETIDRHGKIVGGLKTEINSIYDTMTGQRTWHAVGGCNRRRTDVIKLISHLQKEDLFNYHGGRTYKSFKKFTLKSCNSIGSMLTKIERLSKKLDRRKRIL